jgi:hypothetical protein
MPLAELQVSVTGASTGALAALAVSVVGAFTGMYASVAAFKVYAPLPHVRLNK